MRWIGHGAAVLFLTILSQLGGLAWLGALAFRRRWIAFAALYVALWGAAYFTAPLAGRVALPCLGEGALRSQSVLYCALGRHYVTPETRAAAQDLAAAMEARFPGTQTLTLDGGFPFGPLPLAPHLSHRDGRRLDLAFYYAGEAGYARGKTRSPLGYFAFESGPTDCPPRRLTLRWDLAWLQGLWRDDLRLDAPRMRAALTWLAEDPRVTKVFIEPHLKASLGVASQKIRFQGCRAARHDDHIHLETRLNPASPAG